MSVNLLTELLKIGGIVALCVGVLFLLYRQLMNMKIFPMLTKRQSFILLLVLIGFVFLVTVMAFNVTGRLDFGGSTTNIENTNMINSGDSSVSSIITGD